MNLKLQKLSKMSMAFLMALFSVWGLGQTPIYSTGFEAGFTAGTNYQTTVTTGPSGGQWKTYYGTPSTTDPLVGGKSLQMRLYNNGNIGYTQTEFGTANISRVTFKAKASSGISVKVGYSINGGTSWLGEQIITLATSVGDYEYLTGLVGSNTDVRIKFTLVGTPPNSGNRQLFIDDVNFYAPATQTAAPTITATGVSNGTDNFWNTAQVTLESSTSGASIYYTVDNSDPTAASIQYSTPFSVSSTTTVKAIAIDGTGSLSDSDIISKTITISTPSIATIPYTQDFNDTLGDWMNFKESGNSGYTGWAATSSGVQSNGYNQGTAKGWLISPKFINLQANSLLSFDYASQYEGDDLKVVYSTDYAGYGDPTTATWTDLTTIAEAAGTSLTTGSLTDFVISVSGNVHFAFVYEDANAGGWAMWRVSNFSINAPVAPANTTWNGTSWSNGTPATNIDAIFTGSYTTSTTTPAFTANNITIQNGGVLEITSGNTITALNVTVEDGGNLIQRDGSTLTSASFKVLRNSTSVADKYVFWSSPIADQNIYKAYTEVVNGVAPTYVMTYDTASNYYDQVTNVDTNFTSNAGKGYSVKVPQLNAALAFGGASKVPNNGPVNVALSGASYGYNLIGNPYPSNINLSDFYNANSTSIGSTMWFWDNTTANVATQNGNTAVNVGYATFNASSGTWTQAPNTAAGAGYDNATLNGIGAFAKIGQGFIVKAPAAGTATFTNAIRSSDAAVTLNKNLNATEGKFWIKLATSYGNNVTQAITYSQGASDAYDGYDSKAMGMGSDAFYSLAGAEKLIIQGKAPFHVNDVVQLGNKHFETGNFTISLSHKEGLFTNGQEIYLHDKQTGAYTNLQNGVYSFSANAGDFTNRFEIVYKLGILSTNEAEKETFEIYRDGEDFVVRNHKNIQSVEVYDAAGRKIQQITANLKSVKVKVQAKGMYILKAVSEGKEYTQKIIK